MASPENISPPDACPRENPWQDLDNQKEGQFPPELEPYAEKVREFIDTNRLLLDTAAGDSSLQYVPGFDFSFNHRDGVVTLNIMDWKLAAEKGEDPDQILFKALHELGHFHDLREDSKGYLAGFENSEIMARRLGPRIEAIWQAKLGGQLPEYLNRPVPVDPDDPKKTMKFSEAFAYSLLLQFRNCLMDIHDNNTVGRLAQPFSDSGDKKDTVMRLYRDFSFPTDPTKIGEPPEDGQSADLSDHPRNYQLGYYLLRKHMVPDQEIAVSPEVRKALDKKIIGQHALVEVVDDFCRPSGKYDKIQHTAGYREEQTRRHIEPEFIKLLLKDVEQLPPPPESFTIIIDDSDQEKDNEGEEAEKSPWGSSIKVELPISKKHAKDYAKDQKEKEAKAKKDEAKQESEKRLTPQQRAAKAQAEDDAKFCKEHNINPAVAREYRKIERTIEPYKIELAEIFKKLAQTVSDKVVRVWEEGFRSGRFNVDRFIRKYGQYIQEGAEPFLPFDQLDAFDQREFISRLSIYPSRLRARLVLDGSGSMNENRLLALKQISVLIMESLAAAQTDINNMLNARHIQMPEPFRIDTEMIMFGSPGRSRVIKPFGEEKRIDPQSERANRLRSYTEIHSGYGGTCDAEPWWQIDQGLNDTQYLKDLKSDRAREIIIEVTDGGSNEACHSGTGAEQDTRDAIAAVAAKGVITRGFQIGNPDQIEKQTFDHIWGTDGARIENLADLAPNIARTLAEELKKIEVQVIEIEE